MQADAAEPTPEQLERQIRNDDQTIFVLAALMLDLYMATVTKNARAIQVILPNAGKLLKTNPGFAIRFKLLQQEKLKAAGKELPQPSRIITS